MYSIVDANKPRQKIMNKNDILFSSGYAGGEAKCNILIDGIYHVLELDQVRELILEAVETKGYDVVKTNKQKYPRVKLGTMLKVKKSIRIPISTNDAEELRDGATFEWSFPVEGSASSEWIDVELVGTDEEEL
jgi:hypothetical protein